MAHSTTMMFPTVAPSIGVDIQEKEYLPVIISWLKRVDRNNQTIDYRQPFVWPSLKSIYPLFVFLHACVAIFGSVSNIALLIVLFRRRHHAGSERRRRSDPTLFFLANLALSDLIKAAIVLPITVANLTIANWLYGSALCFLLPMMHSLPVHVSLLTHVAIAIDRYRLIVAAPMQSRAPARTCVLASWVIAGAAVLPCAVYVKYIDLGRRLGEQFDGVGICYVKHQQNVEQYVRASFVVMFCVPLAVIAFLYVRISVELKASCGSGQTRPAVTINLDNECNSSVTIQTDAMSSREPTTYEKSNCIKTIGNTCSQDSVYQPESPRFQPYADMNDDEDEEIDPRRESRTQCHLTFMIIAFALCWCPLNIMMLVTHFVYENHNNGEHFDITYLILTLCGYMSTCINAPLFASWRMSQSTRERLRGYLRFSNRNSFVSTSANPLAVEGEGRSNSLHVPIQLTNFK